MINYIIIIFIIVFIYLRFKYKVKEGFITKKIEIPKYIKYYPTIIYPDDIIYNYIATTMSKLIKVDTLITPKHSYKILETIQFNKNLIGLCPMYDFLEFQNNLETSNIYHEHRKIKSLGQLFNLDLTIISSKYIDLSNVDRIAISYENCGESYVIKFIKQILQSNDIDTDIEIISLNTKINLNNCMSLIEKYDTVAFFMSHPNSDLIKLLSENNINLVNCDVSNAELVDLLGNYFLQEIDRTDYNLTRKIYCISSYILLLTHEYSDNELIYNISKQISQNFLFFKNTNNVKSFSENNNIDNNFLNKSIVYFNENELYINDPIIKFHQGYYDYLVEKGFIVKKDNNICRKLVGIGGCNQYKSQPNPYRIL